MKSKDLKIAPQDRTVQAIERTLESLKQDLEFFNTTLKGKISDAQHSKNVIDEPYFNIPIDQVSNEILHKYDIFIYLYIYISLV